MTPREAVAANGWGLSWTRADPRTDGGHLFDGQRRGRADLVRAWHSGAFAGRSITQLVDQVALIRIARYDQGSAADLMRLLVDQGGVGVARGQR